MHCRFKAGVLRTKHFECLMNICEQLLYRSVSTHLSKYQKKCEYGKEKMTADQSIYTMVGFINFIKEKVKICINNLIKLNSNKTI